MMSTKTAIAVLFVTTALIALPVFAKSETDFREEQLQTKLVAQQAATRALAHKMMGHINLASVALDAHLLEAAKQQVEKAESLAAQLRNSARELQGQTQFMYGKVSYTLDDRSKSYYVPVVDDLFLASDYESTFHGWKDDTNMKETDAGVVWLTVSIDLRQVEKALQDAESKLEAEDYGGASDALAQIFKDAIADEIVLADPIWAVHDNLAFAKNLIDEGHYDAARYALKHAHEELGKLEKDHSGGKESEAFEKMKGEIASLQSELKQRDPSVFEQIGAVFSGWVNTLESWF